MFSETFQQCPFPTLAAVRREAPVCEVANGWYLVATLELARTVLTDPAVHTRYRKLVTRAFTPRALAWMDPSVAQVADEPDGPASNARCWRCR